MRECVCVYERERESVSGVIMKALLKTAVMSGYLKSQETLQLSLRLS